MLWILGTLAGFIVSLRLAHLVRWGPFSIWLLPRIDVNSEQLFLYPHIQPRRNLVHIFDDFIVQVVRQVIEKRSAVTWCRAFLKTWASMFCSDEMSREDDHRCSVFPPCQPRLTRSPDCFQLLLLILRYDARHTTHYSSSKTYMHGDVVAWTDIANRWTIARFQFHSTVHGSHQLQYQFKLSIAMHLISNRHWRSGLSELKSCRCSCMYREEYVRSLISLLLRLRHDMLHFQSVLCECTHSPRSLDLPHEQASFYFHRYFYSLPSADRLFDGIALCVDALGWHSLLRLLASAGNDGRCYDAMAWASLALPSPTHQPSCSSPGFKYSAMLIFLSVAFRIGFFFRFPCLRLVLWNDEIQKGPRWYWLCGTCSFFIIVPTLVCLHQWGDDSSLPWSKLGTPFQASGDLWWHGQSQSKDFGLQ